MNTSASQSPTPGVDDWVLVSPRQAVPSPAGVKSPVAVSPRPFSAPRESADSFDQEFFSQDQGFTRYASSSVPNSPLEALAPALPVVSGKAPAPAPNPPAPTESAPLTAEEKAALEKDAIVYPASPNKALPLSPSTALFFDELMQSKPPPSAAAAPATPLVVKPAGQPHLLVGCDGRCETKHTLLVIAAAACFASCMDWSFLSTCGYAFATVSVVAKLHLAGRRVTQKEQGDIARRAVATVHCLSTSACSAILLQPDATPTHTVKGKGKGKRTAGAPPKHLDFVSSMVCAPVLRNYRVAATYAIAFGLTHLHSLGQGASLAVLACLCSFAFPCKPRAAVPTGWATREPRRTTGQ